MARRFFPLLLLRSLAGRKAKSLLVAGSLGIATAMAAALCSLSWDVQRKVTEELALYGANAALVPAAGHSTFGMATVGAPVAALPAGTIACALLYERVELPALPGARVVVAGVDEATVAQVLRFRLTGDPLPHGSSAAFGGIPALVGSRLAKRLGLRPGTVAARVPIVLGGQTAELAVSGVIATGDAEEDQILVPIVALEELAGLPGQRSAILLSIPGRPADVARAVAAVEPALSRAGIDAKVLRRVAAAGAAALQKIRGLLVILALVVGAGSLLSAGTVLMEQAIERRGEIALMRSLGGADADVARLMLGEAAILGLSGGLAGSLLGILLADLLERQVFGSPLTLAPLALLLSTLLGLALALTAAALPLQASLKTLPAIALKESVR